MRATRITVLAAAVLALSCGESPTRPRAPASIVFARDNELVGLRGQLTLSAVVLDADGLPILPTPPISWTSSDVTIAPVSETGVVSGESLGGPVTITAGTGGITSATTVRVVAGSLTIAPDLTTLAVGSAVQLSAQALDALGDPIPGAQITWANETPGVASLDPSTLTLTALASGYASVRASAAGRETVMAILLGVPTALDGRFSGDPAANPYAEVEVTFGKVTRFFITFRPLPTCSVSITATPNAEIAGAASTFSFGQAVDGPTVSGTFGTPDTVNGFVAGIPLASTSCGPTSGSAFTQYAAARR